MVVVLTYTCCSADSSRALRHLQSHKNFKKFVKRYNKARFLQCSYICT